MATNTDSLRDIYLDVVGEETITEKQQEDHTSDRIGDDDLERTVSTALQDGLDDAVDGAEVGFSGGK